MTAIEKTNALKRVELPVEVLIPNPSNPNKMKSREWDLLCDNIDKVGITDPILVALRGGKYHIVGGHHRWEAAKFLGFEKVPCTVIDDPEFTQEEEDFQLLRHNVIHGRIDPQNFIKLYEKYAGQYEDDLLQDMFGFADEAEFKKLVENTKKSLPPELQEKFAEAAKEIKTVDGLAKLLNRLFDMYGDTLPYGYMVFDYGSQRSVWLRIGDSGVMKALEAIGDICIENKRTMDDVVGAILKQVAKGDFADQVKKAIKGSPQVTIPKGFAASPTKDNLDKVEGV